MSGAQWPFDGDSAGAGAHAPSTRRRRRRVWPWVLLAVFLLIVVGGGVAADTAGRSIAEQQAASRIAASLPDGSGTPAVDIRGGSFLLQLAQGRFDDVGLRLPGVEVQGQPVDVDLALHGVPTDTAKAVRRATGTVTIDQAALAAFAAKGGVTGRVGVSGGAITYADSIAVPVIGTKVPITATLAPRVDGRYLVLKITGAKLDTGGAGIDLTPFLNRLQNLDQRICAAELLPKGATLDTVHVRDSTVVLDLHASDLPLSADALSAHGSCTAS